MKRCMIKGKIVREISKERAREKAKEGERGRERERKGERGRERRPGTWPRCWQWCRGLQ